MKLAWPSPDREWATRLKDVVAAYNSTPHATVHGEPQDVRKDPVQAFLVLEDNAAQLKANQTLLESRQKQLADAGAFRRPLRGNAGAFPRGFKASYGDVEQVAEVALLEFLRDDEKTVASAALWLKTNLGDVGYVDVLRAQGFGKHLAEAIRLFDEFQLTKKGYYVRRA